MGTTRTRMLAAAVAIAAFTAAGCSGGSATAVEPVLETVAPSTARELIADGLGDGDFVLLDVRTPGEFDQVRIDGSVNLDFYAPDFADRLAGLDRDATYVVYCKSGNRSGTTLEMMRDLGFTAVHDVDGGISRWNAEGLPVVTP